jgi:hypothetical protein
MVTRSPNVQLSPYYLLTSFLQILNPVVRRILQPEIYYHFFQFLHFIIVTLDQSSTITNNNVIMNGGKRFYDTHFLILRQDEHMLRVDSYLFVLLLR